MLRRRTERPVQAELAEPPPEVPIIPPPDPVVRAILVGPPGTAKDGLSDLISLTRGLEVVGRYDRAEEAMAIVHTLPARRGVAVLIDVKLPGLHDAVWLIRQLRERHPVLRLFAYAAEGDEPLMEHVALAGVDEVIVLEGDDAYQEVLDAFVRQFGLNPSAEEPEAAIEVSPEQAAEEPPAVIETSLPVSIPAPPALTAAAPAAIEAAPAPIAPAPAPVDVPTPVLDTQPPPVDAPPAPREEAPSAKRRRFHRRSVKALDHGKSDAPEVSAAVRNLERELAGVRNLSPEESRLTAAQGAPRSPLAGRDAPSDEVSKESLE